MLNQIIAYCYETRDSFIYFYYDETSTLYWLLLLLFYSFLLSLFLLFLLWDTRLFYLFYLYYYTRLSTSWLIHGPLWHSHNVHNRVTWEDFRETTSMIIRRIKVYTKSLQFHERLQYVDLFRLDPKLGSLRQNTQVLVLFNRNKSMVNTTE